ncbi:hypothetical protein BDZ85DRAFT_41458 [Elsinoe ampelina]|uniref:F-box domain-containing protein n=1 Tax=Elsinoe ampelina TaxID=302913 RepID=A0A6A6G2R5_9PEZI|nr:hypothetical protein BDZ85DRAFT_41458 [Elsinoe ampelina]
MTVTTRSAALKRSTSPTPTTSHRPPSLPPEILHLIFRHALLRPCPIIVSKFTPTSSRNNDQVQVHWNPDPAATPISLAGANLALLRLNPRLAAETRHIFYGGNKFAFHGHDDWQAVIVWLHSIGPANRAALTTLEIDVRQLKTVWQLADGSRRVWRDQADQPFPKGMRCRPRHGLLQKREGEEGWPEGEVDEVDGRMEEVFALVGQGDGSGQGRKVTLNLRWIARGWPGAWEDWENREGCNKDLYVSMDFWNLVEYWRKTHSKGRDIEVLWHAWGDKYSLGATSLDYIRDQMEVNFEIVDSREFEVTIERVRDPGKLVKRCGIHITFKRKLFDGPIVHSEASPYRMMVSIEQ